MRKIRVGGPRSEDRGLLYFGVAFIVLGTLKAAIGIVQLISLF